MDGLRIFLADDHSLVRRAIRSLLGSHSDWQVCGEASDGREALGKVNELKPDVMILDLNMPELNGLEVTRRVHKMCPQVEVLVLTVQDSEQVMRQGLEAGARGYMLKSDAGDELLTAVETVRRHHLFLSSQTSRIRPVRPPQWQRREVPTAYSTRTHIKPPIEPGAGVTLSFNRGTLFVCLGAFR